jgi:hypothetical protein
MYRFSRSMYRELAPEVLPGRLCLGKASNHEMVLRACEAAILRLARDRHYFAKPTKTLFNDIRVFFPMSAQARVYIIVDRYLSLAREWLESQPLQGYDPLGNRLECRATTRKGKPCQRMPLPHNGYCPSHQHLAETEEIPVEEVHSDPRVPVAA